jgi:HK97 family phage major capsid protein
MAPEPLSDAELQQLRELTTKTPQLLTRLEQLQEQAKKWPETAAPQLKALEEQLADTRKQRDVLEKKLNDRFDQVELRLNRPGAGAGNQLNDADKLAMRAFDKFLRRGATNLNPEELRALEGDDPKVGGFLIPRPLRGQIIEELVQVSPIRAHAAPVTITQGDAFEDPRDDGSFSAGWVGERQARPATGTPNFGAVKTDLKEMYAFPQATQRLIDDAGFDLAAYVARKIRERFGKLEGEGFVNGDGGELQPEGILQNGDVATVNSGSAAALTADGILNLFAAIPTAYAQGIELFMNRSAAFALRKLKDTQGRYLWEPGLPVGGLPGLQGNAVATPASFAGVPIVETPDLPNVAADAKVAFAGNLREAYRIVDKLDVRITPDPYTNKPYVGWYATRRVGGRVIVPGRIKILKVAA